MKRKVGFLRVGRLDREREERPKQLYVRVVTAKKGGEFTASQDIPVISGLSTAKETADSLQADFDADCDPSRAYVLDEARVPIYCAGGRFQS